MVPAPYHVQVNYYQYITELAVMIRKYIPYSSYQVTTVNCYQSIQVLLNNLIIILMQAQQVGIFIW